MHDCYFVFCDVHGAARVYRWTSSNLPFHLLEKVYYLIYLIEAHFSKYYKKRNDCTNQNNSLKIASL